QAGEGVPRGEREADRVTAEEEPIRGLDPGERDEPVHRGVVTPVRSHPAVDRVVAGEPGGAVAVAGDGGREPEVLGKVEHRQEAPGPEGRGGRGEEGRRGQRPGGAPHAGGPPMGWPTRSRAPALTPGENATRPGSKSRITVEPISKAPSCAPFSTGIGSG